MLEEIDNLKIRTIPRHSHTGIDSDQINYDDVLYLEDLVWRKYFYYYTFFESVDGLTRTGTVTIDGTGVTLNTGAGTASIIKEPLVQASVGSIDFAKHSRIRFGVEFGAGSLSSVVAYFTLGTFGIGENYYGFNISNSTLRGSSSNANTTASNAIDLQTLSVSTSYELEARFYPNVKKIIFSVNGVQRGILRSDLPTGTSANVLSAIIGTTDSATKTVVVSYHEILQKR